ncbi:hypothetical protein [Streptomyces sp. NPDC001970]
MADYVDSSDKVDPAWVAGLALDAIQARAPEVVADEGSRNVRSALSGGLDLLYPGLSATGRRRTRCATGRPKSLRHVAVDAAGAPHPLGHGPSDGTSNASATTCQP